MQTSLTATARDRAATLRSLDTSGTSDDAQRLIPMCSTFMTPLPSLRSCPYPCPRQGSYALDPGPYSVARDLLSYLGGQLRRRVALVPDVAAAGLAQATPVVGATKVRDGLGGGGGEKVGGETLSGWVLVGRVRCEHG